MSTEILCSPEELKGHASAVKSQSSDSQSQINALRTRLTQLSTQFKGKAADAFDTRYEEWDKNAKGLLDALDALGTWLDDAATTLEDVDTQLASGLQG